MTLVDFIVPSPEFCKKQRGKTFSPVYGDRGASVAFCDKTKSCVDANTGKELWYYQTYAPIVSSPAVVDGNLYFGCNDHKLYCLDVSDGELLWAFDTGESDLITFDARILASPTVARSSA